jgi:uncharacterized protein with HEPN domain
MTNAPRYDDYFRDILDAIQKAAVFINGMSEPRFRGDEKTQYAVIRAIEIIGEASKRIPDDIRRRYPSIPWREMTGMRDKRDRYDLGTSSAKASGGQPSS